MTKKILFVARLPNGWGTFWKNRFWAESGHQIGWFVGWTVKKEKVILTVLFLRFYKKGFFPTGVRAFNQVKEIFLEFSDQDF